MWSNWFAHFADTLANGGEWHDFQDEAPEGAINHYAGTAW